MNSQTHAASLFASRLTIASLALGSIVLWRREPLPGRRDVASIALVGLFWFGLYNIALNAAEQARDNAAHAADAGKH